MTEDPSGERDLAVVGAGIVGLAVAREVSLRLADLRIVVLEREDRIAKQQSGHSSGVVHSGIYYAPGSLKARLCVTGARRLYEYCDARGIPTERRGKVIVASAAEELPRLDELERRGRKNGVAGLSRLDPAGLEEVEPHARGIAALHSPHTGVVDFSRVASSLARDLEDAGTPIATGCEVARVVTHPGALGLVHTRGEVRARHAVFCAGARADTLARMTGAPDDPRIVPFRGTYLRLKPDHRHLVRSLVYPVPDPSLPFLGVHLSRLLGGEVLVGPTARLAAARELGRGPLRAALDLSSTLRWPGTWRMARRWWRTGLSEMGLAMSRRRLVADAARYVPELEPGDVLPAFGGVRAQALARDGRLVDDFAVSATDRALHVRNAPSPAATSALPLAELIADRVEQALAPGATAARTAP